MRESPGWLAAALVPLAALLPVLWRVAYGPPGARIAGQNLAALLGGLALLLASRGFGRPAYLDLALVLAVLGPTGTLVFARLSGGLPRARLVRWTALTGVPLTVLPLCVTEGLTRQSAKVLVIGVLLLAGTLLTSAGTQRGTGTERGAGNGAEPGAGGERGVGTTGAGRGEGAR
ncbi:monovalent cation/H+ antiporter complex subunit F [Streptomyces sp. ODS28]|uniref:monovalent cation/H+ antiporter complex subunit F n=1 Tax=Streptomyces sp. ODS28 TaxID=3136688 RepID=UPI0031E8F808